MSKHEVAGASVEVLAVGAVKHDLVAHVSVHRGYAFKGVFL
eukprot:COSAG01_NODE_58591_length_305_cov_0.742718_1_plen_40_part_01